MGKSLPNSEHIESPLRVSAFERTTAIIITVLVFLGSVVAVLSVVWYLGRREKPTFPPLTPLIEAVGYPDGSDGHGHGTLDEPGQGEIGVPGDVVVWDVNWDRIDNIILANFSTLDKLADSADVQPSGEKRRRGNNNGDDEGVFIVPRWERWQIHYSTDNQSIYARQLDYFHIELGAVGGVEKVDYVGELSKSSPVRRSGSAKDESRLYFTWKSGPLRQTDKALLERSGVNTRDRIIVQFYPSDVEQSLLALETQYAGYTISLEQIRRTIFGVRPTSNGFEYYVIEQLYRNPIP